MFKPRFFFFERFDYSFMKFYILSVLYEDKKIRNFVGNA